MPVYVNRAQVTTATTGTGTITLGAAVVGFQTFGAAGLVTGNVVSYTIEDGNAWEVGTGTYNSTGPTLTRTLVASSTGALLNLSGSARVYVIMSAADMTALVTTFSGGTTGLTPSSATSGAITLAGTLAVANGGTGVTTSTGSGSTVLSNSPAFSGTPTAPTAAIGTNTTQIATTAYVNAEIANDAPTKTGGGASGTWGISVTGSAGSASSLTQVATFPTANNQDFNSLTTGGVYNIVWGNFTGTLNTPTSANAYGTLLVEAGVNFITQTYTPHSNSLYQSTRVLYNGAWTAWVPSLTSANYNSYAPTLTGGGASGTWGISITGSAANLSTTRSNWSTNGTITAVVGQLAWKNYGNGHTIFDASASTSPDGTAVNATNAAIAWSATYPTLMGWNGSSTYGVRVDSARVADAAAILTNSYAFRSFVALTSGTGLTYTPPSGCRALKVTCVGGGGGGGGVDGQGTSTVAIGGFGGGGGTVIKWITSIASSYTYTIGAGGTAGTPTANGGAGGTTTFVGTGVSLSAAGGSGGSFEVGTAANASSTPGTGGAGTGGDINITGGSAQISLGISGVRSSLGAAGDTPFGYGARYVASGAGSNAIGIGGGGGGAYSASINNYNGGSGGIGVIYIEEYF